MKLINRNLSIVNDKEKVEHFYSFKNFPILMSTTENLNQSEDIFMDMKWGVTSSGYIQLMTLIDPEVIYKDYHTSGVVGKLWKEHHKNFYNFINIREYEQILEIGGSTGNLATNFCTTDKNFSYNIIEPNSIEKNVNDTRIKVIQGFFENFDFNQKFDTIIHSHCFEHSYDPLDFLYKINNLLTDNGYHYIAIPNMKYWLENNYSNVLSFEHTFYIDESVLDLLLSKSGFTIVDKFVNPHSIFVCAKKTKNLIVSEKTDFSYVSNLFLNYIQNIKKDVDDINKKLFDQKFYMFGGHIFSQMYINMGLNKNQIEYILDNDVNKQEKRLYGTNCIVKSPLVLKDLINPIVVVRAGNYTEEIKENIQKINSTVIFI